MLNEGLAVRLEKKLCGLSALLICLWVIIIGFRPMMDNVDLGWHIAQGRWMAHHFAFYRYDLFNYPNLAHPVVDEYPLFQIVLYFVWCLGWWGPCLLTAVTYGLLAVLLLRAARIFDLATSALLCFCVVLMLFYLQVAFPLRPHMVTYLCIAVLGIFLLRQREATSWTVFWPMALLQIAWVNCHSAFVIGPAMVALFGAEMTLRRWISTKTFPWATIKTWLVAFLLILLACFINPFGWARFYLPFYLDQLESIRAYVGEMEPLYGGRATLYFYITVVSAIAVIVGLVARKGATSYSFLLLTIFFFIQAQSVQKAWPIFGVFIPLLILASGTFAPKLVPREMEAWGNVIGHFFVSTIAGMLILTALNPTWPSSLQSQWREYDRSRSELSLDATAWLKAHNISGRLFHRCEDGGYLQQAGFDQGETYSDTGFGKYDEAFIHEVGLVNERPACVPNLITAYNPDIVICSNFCYQWPYYLHQLPLRLVFYSPNSSVWIRSDTYPALPTVSDEDIKSAFDRDLLYNVVPADITLFGRNIIALNSYGLGDFAYTKLAGLPRDFHRTPWYWEAARILCFSKPEGSLSTRFSFEHEAETLGDDALTAEFRAYDADSLNDVDGTLKILRTISPDKLSDYTATLLLRIELDRKDPAALALARRTDCFDLRNGHHWAYLAQAEEKFGSMDAARAAWLKAVFYYPDDTTVMSAAHDFAVKYNDTALNQAIADSTKVYGLTRSQ